MAVDSNLKTQNSLLSLINEIAEIGQAPANQYIMVVLCNDLKHELEKAFEKQQTGNITDGVRQEINKILGEKLAEVQKQLGLEVDPLLKDSTNITNQDLQRALNNYVSGVVSKLGEQIAAKAKEDLQPKVKEYIDTIKGSNDDKIKTEATSTLAENIVEAVAPIPTIASRPILPKPPLKPTEPTPGGTKFVKKKNRKKKKRTPDTGDLSGTVIDPIIETVKNEVGEQQANQLTKEIDTQQAAKDEQDIAEVIPKIQSLIQVVEKSSDPVNDEGISNEVEVLRASLIRLSPNALDTLSDKLDEMPLSTVVETVLDNIEALDTVAAIGFGADIVEAAVNGAELAENLSKDILNNIDEISEIYSNNKEMLANSKSPEDSQIIMQKASAKLNDIPHTISASLRLFARSSTKGSSDFF